MASFLYQLLPFFIVISSFTLFQAIEVTLAQSTALLFPIRKDEKTLQYYTTLEVSTPRNYVNVVIDLSGQHLWFDCSGYNFPTYLPIPCGSKKCQLAKGSACRSCNGPAMPGCSNNTCGSFDYDPFSYVLVVDSFVEEFMLADLTDGKNIVNNSKSTSRLTFSCTDYKPILEGLGTQAKGVVGLSMNGIALQNQLSSVFNLANKFALCIPASLPSGGVGSMFIGGGKYYFPSQSSEDISKALMSTSLLTNPVSTAPIYAVGDKSDEYFINVKSIKIGNTTVHFKPSLLSIDRDGYGGTKISTIANYTILHSTIFKPFVRAFQKAASDKKIKKVSKVAPFKACFNSKTISKSLLTGPDVPIIDLVLDNAVWKIYGANSIVEVKEGVSCLAFVDGGKNERTNIILGGYQLENYLIEFDIAAKKFRFSSSLLLRNTTCSQSRV